MAKPYRGKSQRVQKKPTTAASAALFVRAYVLKLFHRDDGQAADWPMIAETLLLEAFACRPFPTIPTRMWGLSLSRRSCRSSMDRNIISARKPATKGRADFRNARYRSFA
jgi:hypothetical protein